MKDRLPRVLLIYRAMIPSIRLCGHEQMQALSDGGFIEYKHCSIRELASQDVGWPDIVLLGRLDTRAEAYIAKRLKKMGKYLIYILDDDLLNVPGEISSALHYGTREVKIQIQRMIDMSDALLSPSPLIMEKYAHKNMRRMFTEEPAVNPSPFISHLSNNSVCIGFAGSVDRVSDVESVLKEALEQIYKKYGKKVRFSFFGAIPSFAEKLDAQIIPYQNGYDAYRHMLNEAQWDIGLAPMIDSPFHRYKHYNKFCEYAAAGIIGVFSRYEPYLRLEKTIGIGCFCENTADSWFEAINKLISDRLALEALREEACCYAQQHLTSEVIAQKLMTEYSDVFAYRAPKSKRPVYMRFTMVWQVAARFYILLQGHGWGTPVYIAKRILFRIRKKI